MIVVDANIIVYSLTDSPQRKTVSRVRKLDADWRVPVLWRHEFLNVLATLIRQEKVHESDGPVLWKNAVNLLGNSEHAVNMPDALSISVRHNISGYDAQYISLAKELGALLLTEDKRLIRTFPNISVSMQGFFSANE